MGVVFDVEPEAVGFVAVVVVERLEAVAVGVGEVLEVLEVEWKMVGSGGP